GATSIRLRGEWEQLGYRILIAEPRERQLPRMRCIFARQRQQALDLRLDRLGLRARRLDPPMLDQRDHQVAKQRFAVLRGTAELIPGFLVSHGSILVRAISDWGSGAVLDE